ncbi:MAG: RcnB family protein [Shinella sp.]|uniref:RcnB family protein n=1 Tax=Shinella sp. TaxID=1870904 RepID=UPI0040371BE8
MKLFAKTLLAAIALSFTAAPMAQAQTYSHDRKSGYSSSWKKRDTDKRHHWRQGERVSDWKRRPAVRHYHRHGLRKPARGEQWVKVDNSYLLMSIATGIILGVNATR